MANPNAHTTTVAVAIVPGLRPASVQAALTVGRAVRRIMAQHPTFSELMALAFLAETKPELYGRYSASVRRDPVFAAMTMPLHQFIERFDAMQSSGRIAA